MPDIGNPIEATTMEAKTNTRRHRSVQSWREVFVRFEGSGDSVVRFCRREGLDTSSFHRWRRRLATTAAVASPSREAREPAQPPAKFIEVGSMGAASEPAGQLEVRLELGGGLVLQVVRR